MCQDLTRLFDNDGCRFGRWQAAGINVRDHSVLESDRSITTKLRGSGLRLSIGQSIHQISRKVTRFDGIAARPFANQVNDQVRLKPFRDWFRELYAAVANDERLTDAHFAACQAID